ncbi:type I glyceraldehyde-3-phosphate dehydrogenase [Candidatus Woesebacteria bacterium RIFOXYC1_FULL_31_51]|uniref:Glyceraldehyde-3-phosphate dehydrogenase, type I n=1 Tax=Candidatus Woesebacteria bacterium GW2011_GWC2_31_9 TaxID=1618586 RepID=A0A0F9YJK6_9BACT|nr:MAG: gap, Glyceraldehyde-3-phosphate dehydrogenase [Candidatus Woesebacteria bacterium GW2011_GWF1_31_35]KKP23155.1 MAG: Glyceraldehyde-3-phosphate dehydrogenase, type I [Candidatus Woesebacteria bacterium GW2011_GWC1_30_29]KKP26843.1 MAG: Glyceraldehyde-3-phosphate dehydrogenase, type I [Candidatus Woesebacteria bacterium GW2011_GWD1_31_12]KKP27418.1 MAG: Glyceraldehyde-3-phosphate dehydrogenase, type I [Candidatus Woesebacteria bacterium GW2011_GWB1_31_29]KKP31699.1 MAG: Glyceraldehyde-3-p
MVKVGINGFGRIGRLAFRIGVTKHSDELTFSAINTSGSMPPSGWAQLVNFDTMYRKFEYEVKSDETSISIPERGISVPILAEKDPGLIPWGKYGVEVVIEATGKFTSEEDAKKHALGGAKRVVISAPAKGDNVGTYVIGVNETSKDAVILSNASCTTNCVAPVAAVMHAKFGIEKAMMTTVHSYTDDQNLQDGSHKDLRRARAAACNIVPTTTGAAIATTETIPDLKGIFDGMALRVPVATGSITDFTFLLKKDVTVEEVNNAFKEASTNPIYKDILAVSEGFLVSSDIIGRSESAIVDLPLTQVVAGNMVKVFAWYDNEWGYANRLVEQVIRVGRTLEGGIAPTDPLTLSHTNG